MAGLTPFQCFLGGMAFGLTATSLLMYLLWRAATAGPSRSSEFITNSTKKVEATGHADDPRLAERVASLEERIGAMERLMRADIEL